MICSMTAFARQQSQFDWGSAGWEIRSVNHRYLEPSFKLPESARNLEGQLREILRAHLSRGKIDIGLRLQLQPNTTGGYFALDDNALAAIIDAAESVYGRLQKPAPINPLEILQWPGVLAQTSTEESRIETQLLSSFQQTITQLVDSRAREGAVLAQFIEQRLIKVTDIIASVRQLLPEILSAQRQKLKDRLAELKSDLDSDRLEQEMVILAQKADVDEELDRLSTHVEEVTRVIKKGGHCGRRLDFLMQELNREANTLSSKSIVSETTQAAVELKVLIEQMREQIQNIE